MDDQTDVAQKALLVQHILKRVPLTADEQAYLFTKVRVNRVLSRHYLVQQGDVCRYESFVCEGFLRSFFVDRNGDDHTLQFAMEDWWISDLRSFVDHVPATRNVVAMEPCIVVQIGRPEMDDLLRHIPAFEKFWRLLNERAWIAADERILDNIALTGAERYEALLKKYPFIEQRLPQKYIASYLGITPVFLSQIRKKYLKP